MFRSLQEPLRSEMRAVLEEGKRKQREHIAKLEADPEWRKMAARLGARPGGSSYREFAETLAAERLGPSTRPLREDFDSEVEWLEAQQKWASRKAKEMGWSGSEEEFNQKSAAIDAKNEATMRFMEKYGIAPWKKNEDGEA